MVVLSSCLKTQKNTHIMFCSRFCFVHAVEVGGEKEIIFLLIFFSFICMFAIGRGFFGIFFRDGSTNFFLAVPSRSEKSS